MLPCHNKCAYKRNIPGDTHVKCIFQWLGTSPEEFPSPKCSSDHALRQGWFMHPLNFDPTWGPDECSAFSETEDPETIR